MRGLFLVFLVDLGRCEKPVTLKIPSQKVISLFLNSESTKSSLQAIQWFQESGEGLVKSGQGTTDHSPNHTLAVPVGSGEYTGPW